MKFRWPDGIKAAGREWRPDPDVSGERGSAWYSSGNEHIAEVALEHVAQGDEPWVDPEHEKEGWQTGDMSPDDQWVLTTRGWASMDDIIYEEAADFFGEDADPGGMSFPMTFGEAIEQGWFPGPKEVRREVPHEVAEPTPWEHEAAKRSFKTGYEQGYADAVEDATTRIAQTAPFSLDEFEPMPLRDPSDEGSFEAYDDIGDHYVSAVISDSHWYVSIEGGDEDVEFEGEASSLEDAVSKVNQKINDSL